MKFISNFTFASWPGKSGTPTFGNINLTESMKNLIVTCKFDQKQPQESLFAP